jgi:SAM-dependent methyltransferase
VSDPGAGLQAFYEAGYTQADPERGALLGRWRALGARSKAAHVVTLLGRAGVRPAALVEIGCGDGALLAALADAGVAGRYDGFELSGPAAAIAAGRGIPGAGRIEAYDGARVPADDGAYDVAVVSHVLEHVPDPPALLAEAARVARWVVVEVPLEDNRSARRPAKVAEARAIGHIQAFSRADVARLAAGAGLRVHAALGDPLPRAHHAFFAAGPAQQAKATAKWAVRRALWTAAPGRAERLFTVHHAALLGPVSG